MSEVLVRFDEPIAGPDGRKYFALAVGKETSALSRNRLRVMS